MPWHEFTDSYTPLLASHFHQHAHRGCPVGPSGNTDCCVNAMVDARSTCGCLSSLTFMPSLPGLEQPRLHRQQGKRCADTQARPQHGAPAASKPDWATAWAPSGVLRVRLQQNTRTHAQRSTRFPARSAISAPSLQQHFLSDNVLFPGGVVGSDSEARDQHINCRVCRSRPVRHETIGRR